MLGTTLRICVITTSITLVLAYVVAYVLTHAGPTAQRLMMLGVLLPLWMSVLVRAFAWVTLLRAAGAGQQRADRHRRRSTSRWR